MGSALKAYENEELQQDFLKGKSHNVYKAIVDEVMEDLVQRGAVIRDDMTVPYAEVELCRYRKAPALTEDKCREITRILLGDENSLERMFPLLEHRASYCIT